MASRTPDVRFSADPGDLAREVRRRRRDLGLSQQDLALLAGVGTRLVHEVEQGATSSRLDRLLPLLAALGLHLELRPGASPEVVVPS